VLAACSSRRRGRGVGALSGRAASQKGAKKTASGWSIGDEAGAGDSPTKQDDVVCTTPESDDGSVFDSSIERGEPADFLPRMIPCWTEGLQLMKPGGKAVITCPAELAYGDTGLPPGSGEMIAPGAALRFEVELIRVGKSDAAKSPEAAP
jgi:FKBP-type peptidyl-prolyl cis-trans isomerase